MKTIKTEKRLCDYCMEEHDVQTVRLKEQLLFKGISVHYDAEYFYCSLADELFADEKMVTINDISMKNAYRKANGLLSTDEMIAIRSKYGISQKDLCVLLGWGGKTITRYESHQVQDKAHDTILRKLNDDPEWFLTLLSKAKDVLSPKAYVKYEKNGIQLYEKNHDIYLKRAILAKYAGFERVPEYTGEVELSLERVVDMIRYFANASQMAVLYKVKLMKLLWYADALSYKRRKHAISGMVYQALPMGAVPVGHDLIMDLSGISYEEIEIGDGTAYRFLPTREKEYAYLSQADIEILEVVIKKFGRASKKEIVEIMHREDAYMKTAPKEIIPFKYASNLSLE